MQYPQIQFYRGSLVRLASGQLKQVENLSSDDFLESARLVSSASSAGQQLAQGNRVNQQQVAYFGHQTNNRHQLDENNNNNNSSVFNSPEPTPSYDSPTLDFMDTDEDEELDVVSPDDDTTSKHFNINNNNNNNNNNNHNLQELKQDDLYIDSSVVRDILEVGPIPTSASSTSSNGSNSMSHHQHGQSSPFPSTSSSSSSPSSLAMGPLASSTPPPSTVLIKFFLESSRSVVFIEVPIEHPFFVFHRGWSSWTPQRTYDKFGLKCRKLKIGDTCISLIRRQHKQNQQQDSDQCNILFSSIKIKE